MAESGFPVTWLHLHHIIAALGILLYSSILPWRRNIHGTHAPRLVDCYQAQPPVWVSCHARTGSHMAQSTVTLVPHSLHSTRNDQSEQV